MNATKIPLIIAGAALLSLALYLVNDYSVMVLPLFLFSLASAIAIGIVATRFSSLRRKARTKGSLLRTLRIADHYNSNGFGLQQSIRIALKWSSENEATTQLESLVKRLMLGGSLNNAIPSLRLGKDPSSLKALLQGEEQAREERMSRAEGSAGTYALSSMFISTVVPSFVTFSLVGGSILSGGKASLLLFSLLMLGVIPLLYAAINLVFAGVYLGS